jgi:hypothetical protein
MSEAACFACGVAQPYGQIRCDVCGEPLVFPRSVNMLKPGQFRDMTALETLQSGESEAMERLAGEMAGMGRVATMIDARFASIEANVKAMNSVMRAALATIETRLKALEEAHAAVQGGARFGGVVSPTPRQANIEQLPQDRDASGSAVEAIGEVPLSASGRTATARDDG